VKLTVNSHVTGWKVEKWQLVVGQSISEGKLWWFSSMISLPKEFLCTCYPEQIMLENHHSLPSETLGHK